MISFRKLAYYLMVHRPHTDMRSQLLATIVSLFTFAGSIALSFKVFPVQLDARHHKLRERRGRKRREGERGVKRRGREREGEGGEREGDGRGGKGGERKSYGKTATGR